MKKNPIFFSIGGTKKKYVRLVVIQLLENDHNAAHYTIGLAIVFITSSVHINAESSTDKFGSMSQAENWTKGAKKRY